MNDKRKRKIRYFIFNFDIFKGIKKKKKVG